MLVSVPDRSTSPTRPSSVSSAAWVTISEAWPITSATPAEPTGSTSTLGMLRKLFNTPVSSGSQRTRVGPFGPHLASASAACLVAGVS